MMKSIQAYVCVGLLAFIYGCSGGGAIPLDCTGDTGHIFYDGVCYTEEEFEETFPDDQLSDDDSTDTVADGGDSVPPVDGGVTDSTDDMCTPPDITTPTGEKTCSDAFLAKRKRLIELMPPSRDIIAFIGYDKNHPLVETLGEYGADSYTSAIEQALGKLGYGISGAQFGLSAALAEDGSFKDLAVVFVGGTAMTAEDFEKLKEKMQVGSLVEIGAGQPFKVSKSKIEEDIIQVIPQNEDGVDADYGLLFTKEAMGFALVDNLDQFAEIWKGNQPSLISKPDADPFLTNCDYFLHGAVKLATINKQFVDEEDIQKISHQISKQVKNEEDQKKLDEFLTLMSSDKAKNNGFVEFGLKAFSTEDEKIFGKKVFQIHMGLWSGKQRAARLSFEFTDKALGMGVMYLMANSPYMGDFEPNYDHCVMSAQSDQNMCAFQRISLHAEDDLVNIYTWDNPLGNFEGAFTFADGAYYNLTSHVVQYMGQKVPDGEYVKEEFEGLHSVKVDGNTVEVHLENQAGVTLCEVVCQKPSEEAPAQP